jgi:uncharacterized damage-inducible protein DinB
MKETERIKKLLEDLYEGSPWIDVNIIGTLEKITAEQAAKRVLTKCNSIWEIVNHLISWRLNVLQRIQGKVIKTPGNNYITPIEDPSPPAWKNTLKQLNDSQTQWIKFLETMKEEDFTKIYPGNGMTYYEHIHEIIQHDAYHLGQITLLVKLLDSAN